MGIFRTEVITLAPDIWPVLLGSDSGLVGRAFADKTLDLHVRDLRDYGKGVHKKVDDAPFGGGAGMVLMVEPLHRAVTDARASTPGPVILLDPRGAPFTQKKAKSLSQGPGMTLICGRYEGVDQRIFSHVDEVLCVGDFVLSAGDPAAWCVVDAVCRLQEGVLGNRASLQEESFQENLLEYPQFTRPETYEGMPVPEVLRSGDHGAIEAWRQEQRRKLTHRCRPDLIEEKKS
ncbi:MAG: tRNA (guanosine(37)-N1)-methyltransferase TrmD [Myxococcota bacterium]|jgi:tRNA (guanine37-N1)-methyltransferase|nr:tRNA (guanosine(37)-N1)-methyltransferase TrmD [Myxococcota bacterium]